MPLPLWADATTELAFTKEALDAGRACAVKVWNSIPSDLAGATIADTDERFEDAAYAFAIITECARVDGLKMAEQGGGFVGDPAPNILKALPAAQAVSQDFTNWAIDVKTRCNANDLGM